MVAKDKKEGKSRGEVTAAVLAALVHGAKTIQEILEDVSYYETYRRFHPSAPMRFRKKNREQAIGDAHRRVTQRCYALLGKLKKEGLVQAVRKQHGKRVIYKVTAQGQTYLSTLVQKIRDQFPSPEYDLELKKTLLIVSFDIPEGERKKRAWIRRALENLGLKKVHKSVWIGKSALPQEFIHDLREMHLVQYVEIFGVTKAGTLREMV
jgi:DNA-binding PadR family transcriptional regulator